jgi:hypothetical protein
MMRILSRLAAVVVCIPHDHDSSYFSLSSASLVSALPQGRIVGSPYIFTSLHIAVSCVLYQIRRLKLLTVLHHHTGGRVACRAWSLRSPHARPS